MTQLKQENSQNIVQLVLIGLLIGASFFIGMLWTKVQSLETSGKSGGTNVAAAPTPAAAPNVPEPATVKDLDPVTDQDHIRGNKNARYALVEYSDFECPFCKRFHPTAKQALDEYGDKIKWVYRHFPLDSIHPNARPMAIASECVFKLGGDDKFWQFNDVLMNSTTVLTNEQMAQEAQKIGVNSSGFNSCVTSKETASAVESDYQSGLKAGITGTPGNIILDTETGETTLLPGAVPFTTLKQAIDAMMAK